MADRLERAVADEVKLLALTLDERALMLSALDDPPQELAELRAVTTSQPAREGPALETFVEHARDGRISS